MSETESMHPAARKFLEMVFQDVTVGGVTRRLEFRDEPDGTTSVLLIAPTQLGMPTVELGFPADWWPPEDEEWDESLDDEYPSVGDFLKWMTDPKRPALPSEAKREEDRKKAGERE